MIRSFARNQCYFDADKIRIWWSSDFDLVKVRLWTQHEINVIMQNHLWVKVIAHMPPSTVPTHSNHMWYLQEITERIKDQLMAPFATNVISWLDERLKFCPSVKAPSMRKLPSQFLQIGIIINRPVNVFLTALSAWILLPERATPPNGTLWAHVTTLSAVRTLYHSRLVEKYRYYAWPSNLGQCL